jgi:cytochrome c
MPTPDRLAAPPTVEHPTQADTGAQVYWLNCQPCHGDVGQGLTDEWRAQYPPEDQDCWESGCHGDRPYESGFTLPQSVPPVIGTNALARFSTAADLYRFVSVTMPFNAPGSLSEAEYWSLTAFLMRANGLPPVGVPTPAGPLDDPETAALIGLHGPLATPISTPPVTSGQGWGYAAVGGALVLAAGAGLWLWRQRRGDGRVDEKPAN